MYEYPIFKNLVQFSSLIDANGKLKDVPIPPSHKPEEKKNHHEGGENARNDDSNGGDDENYEGGDGDPEQNVAPTTSNMGQY